MAQKGFHRYKDYVEVYQVWSDPNVKVWCPSADDVEAQRRIAKAAGEDSNIYVQDDMLTFRAIGQIGGVVPAGCDAWGTHTSQ